MLAIVIPFFKIDFIEATLQSLTSQKNKNFNVYLGDDASPNDPRVLLKKFAVSVTIKYKKFEGRLGEKLLYEYWERCLGMIDHETWFMLLGDDDILSENVVDNFYKNLQIIEQEDINVVKFSSVIIDGFGKEFTSSFKFQQVESSIDLYIKKLKNESRSSLSEHIFKKSKYETCRFYPNPLVWHSDDMLILQASVFNKVFCINESIANIRVSAKSISGNQLMYNREKAEATISFHMELLENHHDRFSENRKAHIYKSNDVGI
ncbi:glycosyltransferase [Parapedobacter indicus]|uniref:Glycosyltransferase 2-like domain-containing protein n=1 Tax=Parapedobacter indicus TaxID=1477437 RepID=A0A1I3HT91_9SPHI|nr:glycosyltransferase [Parapedobacter indicus]PPL03157.1 hypothetical protein CLV26_103483 [Parapedobacter indicus]SFI38871.1 hypothetical protein SAMN05444682_103482 [Parapedobacter indicus]